MRCMSTRSSLRAGFGASTPLTSGGKTGCLRDGRCLLAEAFLWSPADVIPCFCVALSLGNSWPRPFCPSFSLRERSPATIPPQMDSSTILRRTRGAVLDGAHSEGYFPATPSKVVLSALETRAHSEGYLPATPSKVVPTQRATSLRPRVKWCPLNRLPPCDAEYSGLVGA